MNKHELFFNAYDAWEKDCDEEMAEKGHIPEEWEYCENGQCHYLGSMVMTGKGYVTPWADSPHYVPN